MLQHNEDEAAVGYLAKKKLSSSANKASPSAIVTLLDLELNMCWIPHHTCLVVTTMVLYLLLYCPGLSDASLHFGSGNTVLCLITRPKCSVPFFQQALDLLSSILLVGIDPDPPFM